MSALSLLPVKARARDIGPTLPKYIVTIMIIFPNIFRLDVRFLDSPTVAVALTVSYNMSQSGALQTVLRSIEEIKAIEKEQKVTAIAFFNALSEILLLNRTVSRLPVIDDRAAAAIIKNVTVLIPPAVPTGEPPINIISRHKMTEGVVSDS